VAIRRAAPADLPQLARMRRRLLPDEDGKALDRELPAMLAADESCAVFVAEAENALSGFVEVGVRSHAEGGPDGPAAYIEGIWVEPERRRRGIAGALLAAVEAWARDRGLAWLGSDALIDNALSHAWHEAAGFAEIERLVRLRQAARLTRQRAARRSPSSPRSASRRPGASASAA